MSFYSGDPQTGCDLYRSSPYEFDSTALAGQIITLVTPAAIAATAIIAPSSLRLPLAVQPRLKNEVGGVAGFPSTP